MLPAAYIPFFTAAVGSAGALIGLLFIAISIAPERTVGKSATLERAALAGNAFTALSNVFFISLVALIPAVMLGGALFALGIMACIATVRLATHLFSGGWRKGRLGLVQIIRRFALVAASLTIYGMEVWLGARSLWGSEPTGTTFSAASILIVGGYALVLVRMWSLLGAHKDSFLAWFSLLNDVDD